MNCYAAMQYHKLKKSDREMSTLCKVMKAGYQIIHTVWPHLCTLSLPQTHTYTESKSNTMVGSLCLMG